MRAARLESSLCEIAGTESITPRNRRWSMTSSVQSVAQIAVAVRGPWSSRESSPTTEPGPSVATLRPLRLTSISPSSDHEGLATGLALIDDQRARGHADLVARLGHFLEFLVVAPAEEGDLTERVQMLFLARHGRNLKPFCHRE